MKLDSIRANKRTAVGFSSMVAANARPAGRTPPSVEQLVAEIQSPDARIRGAAWQGAASLGAPAVQPLARLMAYPDFEIARAAKRALWNIVRHAARPNAPRERKAVQTELVALLRAAPDAVRCEALWMLSEIGDREAVKPIESQLADPEAREAARCALERIPGPSATRALQQALRTAPEDFRHALAHSLRVRGRPVKSYPSQKLIPTKPTAVQPC